MPTLKIAAAALGAVLVLGTTPAQAQIDFKIGSKTGDPLRALPAKVRSITAFGERPVFSPDGRKIAFIGKSYGDAFEYDLASGTVRNLTAHNPHSGFVRVHYLADGNFILLGPREMGRDREDTRSNRVEMWFMGKAPGAVLVPLGQFTYEGVALSKVANRIVWSSKTGDLTSGTAQGYTALMVADLVYDKGAPRLANIKEIVRKPFSDCVMEPQNFRDQDREVTASCYGGSLQPDGGYVVKSGVWGVRIADGKMTQYYVDSGYNEVEGISPDGRWTTVECGPAFGKGLDICRLDLDRPGRSLVRLTHFLDYGPHRVSNPDISPDGRTMAFQYGRAEDEAGIGRGLMLMDLTAD